MVYKGLLVFSAPTNAMEVPLGKLQKKNAIAHFTRKTCAWTQSAGRSGLWMGGVSTMSGLWVVEGWKDGCSNNQRPGALASLEAG